MDADLDAEWRARLGAFLEYERAVAGLMPEPGPGIGIIAALDPLGHPERLPADTVVWPCGAGGCCCRNCRPEQACPTRCPVEPINGIPGAHHHIIGDPDRPADVDDIYRRLRADSWTLTAARDAAIRR